MEMVEITMSILAVCVSVLAILGTLTVILVCGKELFEYFADFLKRQRDRKKANSLDNFQYMTLDEAIVQCGNKRRNSLCDREERASYNQLESWLIELKGYKTEKK